MSFKRLLIFSLILVAPFFVEAKSYDFYVDDFASGEEDGSEENPFKEIETAIEKAVKKGGSQDIFIEKGEYKENVTIEKSISLYGKDEGKVKIIGTVTMKDDSHLENLTVDGGNFAIVIDADADAEIKDCTIEDFGKTGIHSEVGGGKLTVTGSKIRDGEGKGFYIQKGKEVFISGNEVYDNDEEGIDIRSNVDGKIQNNVIQKNGESGIELVVGKVDLKITNNNIKYNGSSGIATQFYPDPGLNKKGDLRIENNKMENNDKYGLDCNRPQGGSPDEDYWRDSMELEGNSILGNKIKAISDYCKFIKAVDEDEEVDNSINNSDQNQSQTEEKESELTEEEKLAKQKAEEERLLKEQNDRRIEEMKRRMNEQEESVKLVENSVNKTKEDNKLKLFFFGPKKNEIDELFLLITEKERELFETKKMLNEIHVGQEEENSLREEIDSKIKRIDYLKNFLEKRSTSFSVAGWLNNVKNKIIFW